VGGVEKTAIEQVHGLRNLGVDSTLIILKRGPAPEAFRERLAEIPVEYLDDRLPSFVRRSFRIPGFTFFSLFHLIYSLAMPMRVGPGEWDVIVVHNSYSAFTAWTLWKAHRVPYCIYMWDPVVAVLTKAYPSGMIRLLRPLLVPLGKFVDRSLVGASRGVLVSSYSHVKYLTALVPNHAAITVAPPGCFPAEVPRETIGHDVLSATAWKPGKQLEVLLEAAAIVPRARFVIAGRWLHRDYRARIDSLINALSLWSRVRIEGEYDEAGMARIAATALCLVITSAELGFGMPAIEAAAQACTFICPRTSGIAAFFSEGIEAFYFDEGDSAGLARVVGTLTENPDVAYRAGRAAWQRARTSMTWQHHARTVAQALAAYISE
jgi:glycosyltransferase involved in cell wall biosynthesis